MFRKILVPVDFSAKNLNALRKARELAELVDGEVVLVHVIETIEELPDEELQSFYQRLERKAAEHMQESLAQLGENGFARRSAIIFGHRPQAIVDFAEREEIDVIVMSSHRVDRDRPAADWITISYKVAILARCPVLLVK